jgi:hypothetical protein
MRIRPTTVQRTLRFWIHIRIESCTGSTKISREDGECLGKTTIRLHVAAAAVVNSMSSTNMDVVEFTYMDTTRVVIGSRDDG